MKDEVAISFSKSKTKSSASANDRILLWMTSALPLGETSGLVELGVGGKAVGPFLDIEDVGSIPLNDSDLTNSRELVSCGICICDEACAVVPFWSRV